MRCGRARPAARQVEWLGLTSDGGAATCCQKTCGMRPQAAATDNRIGQPTNIQRGGGGGVWDRDFFAQENFAPGLFRTVA